MNSAPSISIVMPIYNGAAYLRECLDAVLAQSYGDFELIAVDDGSTDGSSDIVRAVGDARVRYVGHGEHLGIFGNLNRACALARAPLLQILCQDDRLAPAGLERQRACLEGHPAAAMTWCRYRDIDADGRVFSAAPPLYDGLLPTPLLPVQSGAAFAVFGCMPGNLSPVMLRRDAWRGCGGFRDDLTYAGDFEFWIRLSRRYPIVYSGETLVEVRTHANRASHVLNRRLELITEEAPLWRDLLASLPEGRVRSRARRLLARWRGVQYLNWVLRAAVRGDGAVSRRGLADLRRTFGVARTAFYALVSLNGRRPCRDRVAVYQAVSASLAGGTPQGS